MADLLRNELPNRWWHSVCASAQAEKLRPVLSPSGGPKVVTAALLHDIGYASACRQTGFHPIDGARYLRARGIDEEIVGLVAHHSCASCEALLRGLAEEMAEFRYQTEDPADERGDDLVRHDEQSHR